MKNSVVLSFAIGMPLMFSGSALGAITNGDFEGPTPAPWGIVFGGVAGECDVPLIVTPLDLWKTSGTHAGLAGDWWWTPVPGCNPAAGYQYFQCGEDEANCHVKFDALFFQLDGESAFVHLKAGNAGSVVELIKNGFHNNLSVHVPSARTRWWRLA